MAEKFENFKKTDVYAYDIDKLVDLCNVEVNRNLSLNKRMNDYVAQVGNPYLFKVGETVVNVNFCGEKVFSDVLSEIVISG